MSSAPKTPRPSRTGKSADSPDVSAVAPASAGGRVPIVKCPQCGSPSRFEPANRWRPFCSERCRMIDLGAWASNAYVVPGPPIASDDET